MDNAREHFLRGEFLWLSIFAAFGRNKIYKDITINKEKESFRKSVKSLLTDFEENYKNSINPDQYLNNLDKLKLDIEERGKKVLREGQISFGTVQKLLNLYLKYLWCAEFIEEEPPHCPIDGFVLKKIKYKNTSFRKLDKDEYREVIERIKSLKGEKSFTQWELDFWNEYLKNKKINKISK